MTMNNVRPGEAFTPSLKESDRHWWLNCRWAQITPYRFLLPGLLLFTLFVILPMLYSARISLYNWDIVHPERSAFLGLQNYQDLLKDPIFQRAAFNTALYALVTVPGQLILGMAVALLLNQK